MLIFTLAALALITSLALAPYRQKTGMPPDEEDEIRAESPLGCIEDSDRIVETGNSDGYPILADDMDGENGHYFEERGRTASEDPSSVPAGEGGEKVVYSVAALGSISGTVTGSESGNPALANVQVKVYDSSNSQVGSVITDALGTYSVGGLASGSYKVYFVGNSTHRAEYHSDKSSLSSADLVNVIEPDSTTVSAALQACGFISGTVRGSEVGNPTLGDVYVSVYDSSDHMAGHDTTDAAGCYSVGFLPTGNYKVQFSGDSDHLSEYFNDKASRETADPVSVEELESSTVDAVLQLSGTISGNVTGAEEGNPGHHEHESRIIQRGRHLFWF